MSTVFPTSIDGVPVVQCAVVKRKVDPDKVYQVMWLVDGDKVRLVPADVDSAEAGARRTTVKCAGFWRVFELA